MDERLRQLIEAVCQQPPGSLSRRKAMSRLLMELQQLPRLLKSSHPDYLEALNQTWEWVSRYICSTFELRTPSIQESLERWINGYLYWRIRDLLSLEVSKTISLDKPIGNSEQGTTLLEQLSQTDSHTPTLSGLDGYIEQLQRQKIQRITTQLERYNTTCRSSICPNCYYNTSSVR